MRHRVSYHWFVVAATFVTLVTAAGILTAPTMFMQPMQAEFGWDARPSRSRSASRSRCSG